MRSIWKGGISFGLVFIPVKLYSGVNAETEVRLEMVRKADMCPIKYTRVCKNTGEEVPWEDVVKGVKYADGQYVILDDDDYEKLHPKRSKTIDIVNFIDLAEIKPTYFDKPYYLEPAPEAMKTYALLLEGLKKSKKAGVAKYILRNREKLGVLVPEGNLIVLNQIRYPEEIRDTKGLILPQDEKISKKELDLALTLINQISGPFKPEEFHDTYKHEMKKIIELKAKNKLPKKSAAAAKAPAPAYDLMEQLKRSLEQARPRGRA